MSTSEMTISPHVVRFGDKLIQVSNISQADLWRDESYKRPQMWCYIIGGIAVLIGLINLFNPHNRGLGILFLAIGGGLIFAGTKMGPSYGIAMQTNAGTVTALNSKSDVFIREVLEKLQDSIVHRGSGVTYHVNVDNKTITEGDHIEVSNSQSVNVAAHSEHVQQAATTVATPIGAVNELISMLRASASTERDELIELLGEVRAYLCKSGKTEQDAKGAWGKFVDGLGRVTDIASHAWNLVSTVGHALA